MNWPGFVGIAVGVAVVAACSGNVETDPTGSGGDGGGGQSPTSSGSGLGIDACAKAVAHVAQCVPGSMPSSGTVSATECTGNVQCQAKCVIASTCESLTGMDVPGAASFTMCLGDCAQ